MRFRRGKYPGLKKTHNIKLYSFIVCCAVITLNVDRGKLITFCINRSIKANANIACCPELLFY